MEASDALPPPAIQPDAARSASNSGGQGTSAPTGALIAGSTQGIRPVLASSWARRTWYQGSPSMT